MNETDSRRHVSWWAHPLVLLVSMPVIAAVWLVLSSLRDENPSQIWRSVTLGVLLGLIGVLANRVVVRRCLSFFVEFYLRPIPAGSPAASFWQRLVYHLPFVAPMWAIMFLGDAYLDAFAAGMAAFSVVWLLTYPEQILIHRTARQKAAQP